MSSEEGTVVPGAGEILVTWPDFDVDGVAGCSLRAAGLSVRLEPKLGHRSPQDVRALLRDAVGAIVSTDPFDADVIDSSTRLQVIARVGVGLDSVDVTAATRRGVAVTVTPGANEVTVADHTLALMLAVLRRVCEHDAGLRRGEWNRTGPHTPWTLSGTTVGLVGYGRIGRLVAERLSGFGVEILVSDPRAEDDERVRAVDLPTLLAAADVVSIHTPLTSATKQFIGAPELRTMRSSSVLINTSRGGVVDEPALTVALRTGTIRGAGVDVFDPEPPRDSELLQLPNVVLSPHMGGLSVASIDVMTRRAASSVVDVMQGRVPPGLANPGVIGALGQRASRTPTPR